MKNTSTLLARAEMVLDSWFGLSDHRHDYPDVDSFSSLARACLRDAGISVPSHDTRQIFTRAMASTDFPRLLSSTGTKILQANFDLQPRTYQFWSEPWPVANFFDVEMPRIGYPGELPGLNPDGGEYQYLDATEGGETGSIESKGAVFPFSRKLLVNDDLGAFKEKNKSAGLIAARTMTRQSYRKLITPGNLSDNKAFFHADRGNLLEGDAETTMELSATSLGLAVKALRSQKDLSGDYIDFSPKYLVIPPAEEVKGWTLCNSGSLLGQDNAGIVNIYKERFGLVPVVSPQLADVSLGGNDRDWYLFADPKVNPACFKMLTFAKDGWPKPFLDERLGWKNDNLELKVRVDFRMVPVNPLGCVKVVVHTE